MAPYRCIVAVLLASVASFCQTRAFAVASVKANTSLHNAAGNKFGPDSMQWTNATLQMLIEETYRLKDYQIIGAPAWVNSERWDIDAKSEGPATSQEKFEMLGTLLADRFQLKFHRETRQLPILRLTLAKNGPKLAPAKPQDSEHRWGTRVDRGLLDMRGTDLHNLVFWLSLQLNQPIVDETGLTGTYDLKLEWSQDDQGDIPISAAVEAQLGLRLLAGKGPVEVLVIEHVARAAGN
jgi:uncharacterized protein (TIGR03435 family)